MKRQLIITPAVVGCLQKWQQERGDETFGIVPKLLVHVSWKWLCCG